MLFKKAKYGTLENFNYDIKTTDEAITDHIYNPCEPNQEVSVGWVSPFEDDHSVLSLNSSGATLLCIKVEKKSVPASVIKEELRIIINQRKVDDPEYNPNKGEKNTIKDEIKQRLLPNAFPKFSNVLLYLDEIKGMIVVNDTSDNAWEMVKTLVQKTFNTDIKILAYPAENEPAGVMTDWIRDWDIPTGYQIGEKCKLKDHGTKTEITYKKHDLDDDNLVNYISTNKEVVMLEVTWKDSIKFEINEIPVLSSIKFLDVYQEKQEEELGESEDAFSEMEVGFTIMVGAFRELIPSVVSLFTED
jgi:recombination associated protein RdgC